MTDSIIHSTGALSSEPARVIGAVTSVLTALVALAVVLGIDPEQAGAIMGVVASILPFVVGTLIRGRVYSPATVLAVGKRIMAEGIETGSRVAGGPAEVEMFTEAVIGEPVAGDEHDVPASVIGAVLDRGLPS